MKKSIKLIIILIIVILLIGYITYINKYKISKKEQIILNKISDKLVITDIKSLSSKETDNYYEFKNIKFNNILNEFTCQEDSNKLTCTNDNAKLIVNIEDSLIAKYKKSNYKNIKGIEVLKNNKIKDDINLMGLIKETKNYSPYFKPINEIKETYSIQRFVLDNIKSFSSIELINTKYEGYIYNIDSNTKEYVFTKEDKNYSFTFKNINYFTRSKRNEIISTLIIE